MSIASSMAFSQRYNMLIGVQIIALLTSILFFIYPIGFLFLGDVYLVIGCCVGLYFTFKNKKESQSHIKTGVIVGLTGSVLSLIFIDLLFTLVFGVDFIASLLSLFVNAGIMYIFVGLILGYIFAYYFRNKEL